MNPSGIGGNFFVFLFHEEHPPLDLFNSANSKNIFILINNGGANYVSSKYGINYSLKFNRSLARADAQLYFYIVANGDEWNTIAVQYLLCMWCVENQQFLTLPATAEMTANKRFEQKKQKLSEQFKSKISIFMTNCALLLLYLINYLMMQV